MKYFNSFNEMYHSLNAVSRTSIDNNNMSMQRIKSIVRQGLSDAFDEWIGSMSDKDYASFRTTGRQKLINSPYFSGLYRTAAFKNMWDQLKSTPGLIKTLRSDPEMKKYIADINYGLDFADDKQVDEFYQSGDTWSKEDVMLDDCVNGLMKEFVYDMADEKAEQLRSQLRKRQISDKPVELSPEDKASLPWNR